uniref:Valacyclovir hydrolase n=1 Tax=Cacopsylla melanoneura TaxID=428564 RepID=A0A8D8Z4X3_9HEMI
MMNLFSAEPHQNFQCKSCPCRCPQKLSHCTYPYQNDLGMEAALLNPPHAAQSNLNLNVFNNDLSNPWNLLKTHDNISTGNIIDQSDGLPPFTKPDNVSTNINAHHQTIEDFNEGYLRIKGCDIRFVKHGHGPRALLFTYGVLGEIMNSFKKQLTAFDPDLFTSIFWDPPGYGKSIPRGRNYIPYQYIEEDVAIAHELLQGLGISQVTLFGWCDGAHMSVLFSLRYPHMVHKLILWGTKASLTRDNVQVFERMRSLSSWSQMARSEVLKAYDNDVGYITGTFNQYVDAINIMYKTCRGELYKELLPFVQVPVLVLHAIDDMMVARHQVMDLKQQLADCRYYQFSSGGHSYHIKHCKEFNQVCLNFIMEENMFF